MDNGSPPRPDIALIIGSGRPGRAAPVLATWFLEVLEEYGGFRVAVVDVATTTTEEAAELLARADGFVVLTPEINHSYPAPLKGLIDAQHGPWRAKPVAFVSYGGISGGLRAVEHLRGVFAELDAVTIRDVVALPTYWRHLDGGRFRPGHAEHAAAKRLLDRFAWWVSALADARARRPYAA